MADTLAIMVSTRGSLPHLLGLVAAAAKRNDEVRIFFSGGRVLVTQEPRYAELILLPL
jgi:hypothetical protein